MILNLATQPFVNRRKFYVFTGVAASVLGLALVVLVALFIQNFRNERGIRKQMGTVRAEIARLESEQQRIEDAFKQPQAADILDRSDFLNSLIRQKAVSWTRIFMDLEKLMPDRVQAVSLRPVVKIPPGVVGGKAAALAALPVDAPLLMDLEMQVSAENIQNLLEMLRRMQKSDNFAKPVLHSETSTKGAIVPDKDNLYNLSLSVTYAQ